MSRWTKGRHGLWPWNSLIASQAIPLLSCWLQRINNTSGVPIDRPSQRQYSKNRYHPPGCTIYCDSHTFLTLTLIRSPGTKWANAGRSPLTIILMDPFEDCRLSIPATWGTRSSKLAEPPKENSSPSRHLLSLISWDRQARRVNNLSQVFHWPAWCQAGPCGAPGHRGLFVPHSS